MVPGNLVGAQVGSSTGFLSTLSSIAYTALLPTLWALRAEPDVIPTTMQHAASSFGAGNKFVKRAAVEFMGRIILVSIAILYAKFSLSSWTDQFRSTMHGHPRFG
jgi:hypothetical protein